MIEKWKQNFATLSPDENSKNIKLTNWIELPYPGWAKNLKKIGVTKMKGFKTGVKIYESPTMRVFKRKPRLSKTSKYLFIK